MATTPKGLRYPAGSDSPNVAQYFQNLASDVDAKLFTHGGTSGAMFGTVPPAGTALIVKTFMGSVTLNANGDGTLVFPGGAFPNGLLSVQVSHYSVSAAPSNNLEFVPWNASLSQTSLRCYFGTAIFGSTGVVANVTAIGW